MGAARACLAYVTTDGNQIETSGLHTIPTPRLLDRDLLKTSHRETQARLQVCAQKRIIRSKSRVAAMACL